MYRSLLVQLLQPRDRPFGPQLVQLNGIPRNRPVTSFRCYVHASPSCPALTAPDPVSGQIHALPAPSVVVSHLKKRFKVVLVVRLIAGFPRVFVRSRVEENRVVDGPISDGAAVCAGPLPD